MANVSPAVLKELNEVVDEARKRNDVKTKRGSQSELSGMMFNEARMFARSLVYTARGTGAWKDLLSQTDNSVDDEFVRETIHIIRTEY